MTPLYAGLDVSVETTSLCVVNEDGEILVERTVSTEPVCIVEVLKNLNGDYHRIGLEAGPLSQWLYFGLRDAGLPAVCVEMHAIKDEFEAYGWRRMQAALRHQGWIVNHKKVIRLMREHDLQPPRRQRYVTTTDSDHDQPMV